jgi:DNA-binding IclR family transcriptional regulator
MPRYPTKAPERASADGVAAVDRALSILGAFRQGDRSLTLNELAARTGLVKSTLLRLLASLIHFALIQRDPEGRYTLGPEVARLQSIYTRSFSLESVVLPELRALVDRTQESAVYHVRQGELRLVLYRVDSPQPIRDHVNVGDVMPLDRGAGGRVLSAFAGAEGNLYDRIRREGAVAVVGDRSPELAGIAAPVFKAGGALAGAVTLTMPASRFTPAHMDPVKDTARAISRKLGWA